MLFHEHLFCTKHFFLLPILLLCRATPFLFYLSVSLLRIFHVSHLPHILMISEVERSSSKCLVGRSTRLRLRYSTGRLRRRSIPTTQGKAEDVHFFLWFVTSKRLLCPTCTICSYTVWMRRIFLSHPLPH